VRAPGGWTTIDLDGLDGTIELPELNCSLAIADIYDGVDIDETK
jgi:hypothetical protein